MFSKNHLIIPVLIKPLILSVTEINIGNITIDANFKCYHNNKPNINYQLK